MLYCRVTKWHYKFLKKRQLIYGPKPIKEKYKKTYTIKAKQIRNKKIILTSNSRIMFIASDSKILTELTTKKRRGQFSIKIRFFQKNTKKRLY